MRPGHAPEQKRQRHGALVVGAAAQLGLLFCARMLQAALLRSGRLFLLRGCSKGFASAAAAVPAPNPQPEVAHTKVSARSPKAAVPEHVQIAGALPFASL